VFTPLPAGRRDEAVEPDGTPPAVNVGDEWVLEGDCTGGFEAFPSRGICLGEDKNQL
jgi:hypothetical protein